MFHQHLNLLWSHAISGDTAEKYIVDVIGGMPLNVVECLSKEQITAAFKLYQQCSFEQKYFTENKIPMPLTRRINEEKCVNAFEQLTSTYSKNFPLETTLLIPLKAYWKMAVHSNLSLHIFQHEWKGKFWMEALRWLCLIIHVGLFTFFLLQLFIGMDKLTALLLFVPMVYFFYLWRKSII